MNEVSGRFALPLLQPGQAQKEITHNEALALVDALLHPLAEEPPRDTPPATPAVGRCWLVGDAPAGAWAGQAGALACWTAGGWRFAAPVTGMVVNIAGGACLRRSPDGWMAEPAIAAPTGGATVDMEARAAIRALLAMARRHGLVPA